MKRLLAAILALVLLTGCAAQTPPAEPSGGAATETAEPSLQLYDASDPIGEATAGAVRAYTTDAECTGMASMGSDLLLFFSQEQQTKLMLCAGKSCAVKAQILLDCPLSPGSGSVAVSDKGVAYYDAAANEVVLLGPQLQVATRIAAPQNLEGEPVLSQNLETLYYCTGSDIRAFDLGSGKSRLLMSQQALWQELIRCVFDDSVLVCQVGEADGDVFTCFLSTVNGETLGRDPAFETMDTYGDEYLLVRRSGTVEEVLLGTREETAQALHMDLEDRTMYPALALGGAVISGRSEEGLVLSLYSTASGTKTAEVTLPGISGLQTAQAQTEGFWFVAAEKETGNKRLYFWNPSQSTVEDETVYIGQRYTAASPDTQALAVCADQAREMGETYGVDVRVWEDAVAQPCDFALEAEYQPIAIQNGLAALEPALAAYPEDFFASLGGGTGSGKLHICLVRSISGDQPCVQYWGDGEAYIAIAIGTRVERTLYHAMSHVLDTFIIARSQAYDGWDALNPEGFAYDFNYNRYLSRTESEYLDETDRSFIDSFAMTYPKEDRAMILEYAMLPDNGGYFTSETMQRKLRTICEAIRESFGWEADARVFPWEQYLAEPLNGTD